MEKDYAAKASEKVKKIVARMKEITEMTAYQLEIVENSKPDIFDSKFGGVPYWDMTKEYPLDSEGEKMMMLAQINFTKAALEDERLPKQGMLQFFISAEDDVFGMDWEDVGEQGYYHYLCEEDSDYLYEECENNGHWILGYPYFTQSDPREYREDTYYDTLLFQMDSDMKGHEDYVLWGDCGVANFFINEESLRKKDFSKVMYNWDCC